MAEEIEKEDHKTMRRTYSDAIAALNSLQSNFASIEAARKLGPGARNEIALPEMVEWSRRAGYPPGELSRLRVVHVAGTKGKGSTCAFADSILNQYSFSLGKVGLYTSPHLKSVRERIRINSEPLAEDLFTKYFFEVWDRLSKEVTDVSEYPLTANGPKPGYFKFLTLLSFHVFFQEGVRTAVYEVGVGGAYDSTNLVESPTATGISALGIDHTAMLGETIEEIAWNKAGIFKTGSTAFTVPQPDAAMSVLEQCALEKGVELNVVDQELAHGYKLGIPGHFQQQNAALAIALTTEHLRCLGVPVDKSKTRAGLEKTFWPGRCQTIKDGKITWFIDGAHTKESVQASSGWFRQVVDASHRPKILIFNQQTRDATKLVKILFDTVSPLHFDKVIFTTNVTWASGDYSADLVSINTSKEQVDKLSVQRQLADFWKLLDPSSEGHVFADIETTVSYVKQLNQEVDVFVCGSLHLVGGFLVVLDGKEATE